MFTCITQFTYYFTVGLLVVIPGNNNNNTSSNNNCKFLSKVRENNFKRITFDEYYLFINNG